MTAAIPTDATLGLFSIHARPSGNLSPGPVPDAFHTALIAGAAGSALVQLSGVCRGKPVRIFPNQDHAAVAGEMASNPNRLFQVFGSPLFPIANRLRGPAGQANVLGKTIHFPLNHHGKLADAEPHHLHGNLFSRTADSIRNGESEGEAFSTSVFHANKDGAWASELEVTVRHSLQNGSYTFEMTAENKGNESVPVGFGAHPYFELPSGDPFRATLQIPADRVAEIDNFDNVFPTGRWFPTENSRFDFRTHSPLPGRGFDHFFHFDGRKGARIELHDGAAGVAFRMTALTENILGAQFYYPGTGSVFALELVTHVPDPRVETWGEEKTGMRLLNPGETETYAFSIEVYSIAKA
ncbi:MAG: aldose 1-epimerase [Cryobacterium sp.]|nr:aldose 1-epimerase [Oligoflexia bacterium]